MIDVQWKLLCSWSFVLDYGRKKGGWEISSVQDSKAKNADKTNFLTSTDVECPD